MACSRFIHADTGAIRNVGIIAHVDAGKTTISERMLFYSGATKRIGNVDVGDTVMDFMPEERERGITIGAAATTLLWPPRKNEFSHTTVLTNIINCIEKKASNYPKSEIFEKTCENDTVSSRRVTTREKTRGETLDQVRINLIDTPGHVDFGIEVMRSLSVMDAAITILDASAGVQAQTAAVWRLAAQKRLPRIVILNKMDKIGADASMCLASIKSRFTDILPTPVQLYLEECKIADLVKCTDLYWDLKYSPDGLFVKEKPWDIDDVSKWESRSQLIEQLAMLDDELMEDFIEKDFIDNSKLKQSIRKLTLQCKIAPVFCASAVRNVGIQPVLDAIGHYLPSPLDRQIPFANYHHQDLSTGKKLNVDLLNLSKDQIMMALAFKVIFDARRGGLLVFVRVFSGTLFAGKILFNANASKKLDKMVQERPSKVFIPHADEYEPVEMITNGNVAVLIGLKATRTGDTLLYGEKNFSIKNIERFMLSNIIVPEPVFSCAVEAESQAHEEQLEKALTIIQLEDPTVRVTLDRQTGQQKISGMGELHLEIVRNRILRDLKARCNFGEVLIAYKELFDPDVDKLKITVCFSESMDLVEPGDFIEKMNPLVTGDENSDYGQGRYTLEFLLEKSEKDLELSFNPSIDSSRTEFMAAIREGVEMAAMNGPLEAHPVIGLHVHLRHCNMPDNLISPQKLGQLRSLVFNSILKNIKTRLCEPMMEVHVNVPESLLGAVVTDLCSSRRGTIQGITYNSLQDLLKNEKLQDNTILNLTNAEKLEDNTCLLHAIVPLQTLLGYANVIRSLTGGEASFEMRHLAHRPVETNRMASMQ